MARKSSCRSFSRLRFGEGIRGAGPALSLRLGSSMFETARIRHAPMHLNPLLTRLPRFDERRNGLSILTRDLQLAVFLGKRLLERHRRFKSKVLQLISLSQTF